MKAGWKTVKLGDIALVGAGNSAPQDDADFSTDGPYFVRTSDVGEVKFGTVNSSNDRLSSKGAKGMRLWKEGTILIPKSGASTFVNHRVILGLDAHVSSHLATIQAEPTRCDARYLLYYLSTVKAQDLIQDQSYPSLKLPEIAGIEIPLPPVAEQKRIVALLDEAFAGIDEAKAKTEANLEKATAVFESHLQSLFAIDNPDWARAKLSSLTTKIGSGATPRGGEESYKDEGVSLIRSLNVHDYGFKYAKLAFLDAVQAEELSGVTVQENDVLLNITGASVARCTIVPRGVLPARVNQHVAIIRPMPEKVSSAFLHYLLISQPYKSRLLETGEEGGSTRQAITKAQLLEFTISHPVSVETQQATAKHLDEVREQTQRLSQLHKQRLDALSALKQSILSQAFAGELTA